MTAHKFCGPIAVTLLVPCLLLGLAGEAAADEGDESRYDKIWSVAQIYTGDSEGFFQSVDLSGRVPVQRVHDRGRRVAPSVRHRC